MSNSQKKRIKVLHLIEDLGSGGAERLLHTNLRYLDRVLVKSEVVTVFSNGIYWRQAIEGLGVRVSSLGCSGFADILSGVRRLRRYLKENRPDVIHTHLWTANIIGRVVGRLSGIPVVSSIHNPEYEPEVLDGVSRSTRTKLMLAKTLDEWTAKFCCDRMIAVSQYVKDCTANRLRFPSEKIDLIYNPVDRIGEDRAFDRRLTRKDLGLPDDAIVLLNVGRLAPQKGFIDAIRAMPEILSAFPHAHLVSIGASSGNYYKQDVVDAIAELGIRGSVHLIGERTDVSSILSSADIFVFPSLYEGLGIALAEAMSVGCPCITSDIRPLDEFVRNEENGILVPVSDPKAIAAAVKDLLKSPEKRHKIGTAARETAIAKFQPEPAANQLTAIYQQMAGRN